MSETVIVGMARTPFGRLGGALADVSAVDLGAIAIKGAVERAGLDVEKVDYVILGQVIQGGSGQMPARQASIKAGMPLDVPCLLVNKVCISSISALVTADQIIRAGDADVIVTGGMESMSQGCYYLPKARFGYRMGNGKLVDGMIQDALWCAINDWHMGEGTDRVAEEFGTSREQQDFWSARSQQRAAAAQEAGKFAEEIVPVEIKKKKGVVVVDSDEHIRPETTVESLAKLPPAFRKEGTITAGNASGINDGAAAVLMMSAEKAKELGLEPFVRIKAFGAGAMDPAFMGLGPIPAVRKVLKNSKMTVKDIQCMEVNEAFAAQAIACLRSLDIPLDKPNELGSGISIGHPIGCTGARQMVTGMYQMKRKGYNTGMITMCIGGGMGFCMVVER